MKHVSDPRPFMVKDAVSVVNSILDNGIMNDALRLAVQSIKDALLKGDLIQAADLSAVKSFIVGKLVMDEKPIQRYRFREDNDANKVALGDSIYCLLDVLHHELAFKTGTVPSGMMIVSLFGIKERPFTESEDQVSTWMLWETAECHEAIRMFWGF